jgi:hypothetical protein
LYQELQELVLSKVHVRVRFYDKIILCLDTTLKENERYMYLVECLVPRPRNLQGNTQTTASKGDANSQKQEKPVMEIATQAAMKTSSHAPTPPKEVEQTKAQAAIPPQENEGESKEAPQGVQGTDVHMEDSTNDVNAIGDDVAMCGALSTLSEQRDGLKWVPPQVTHEFSYPSDEEIIPNPKVSLSKKGLLHDLGKVHKWFKGSNDQAGDGEAASSAAPWLPVTSKNSAISVKPHEGLSPHPYINLESRLPQDTTSLQSVVQRASADTHLKSIASQKVMSIPPHSNAKNSSEGEESDENSSVSLEERPGSPHYSNLAHSLVSDDDSKEETLNGAPAHVVNEGNEGDDRLKGSTPSSSGTKDDI